MPPQGAEWELIFYRNKDDFGVRKPLFGAKSAAAEFTVVWG
jgi:hypothetical protein